jgi:hypothetical protein
MSGLEGRTDGLPQADINQHLPRGGWGFFNRRNGEFSTGVDTKTYGVPTNRPRTSRVPVTPFATSKGGNVSRLPANQPVPSRKHLGFAPRLLSPDRRNAQNGMPLKAGR